MFTVNWLVTLWIPNKNFGNECFSSNLQRSLAELM